MLTSARPAILTSAMQTGVRFTSSEALNDLGQIVMTVQSEKPETFERRTFVVTATPRLLRGID